MQGMSTASPSWRRICKWEIISPGNNDMEDQSIFSNVVDLGMFQMF